jgi:O-antigen/teichoic acid export membrane protein
MLLILPATALSAPLWIYYRQMRFGRQRLIQAADPVLAFVVTVALAAGGAGFWSFVFGTLAGTWAVALISMIKAPFPMRLRFSKETLSSYASFSWPLFASGAASLVLAQSSTFTTNAHLGVAAVGAVALAANLTQFANRVQYLVEAALYPAVCAVKDRVDLLRESFQKSNRLGMIWGMPFGVGLSLFFADLVHFGIGDKWEPAIPLLQVSGLVVAIGQICFNYDAYYRARGDTKPIAIVTWSAAVTFVTIGLPLLLIYDLPGLAAGIGVQAAVATVLRVYYVHKLFHRVGIVRHALAGVGPVIPAAAAVLLMRLLESGDRVLAHALAEAGVFVILTTIAVWIVDGPLIREFGGYLSRRREDPAPASA